MYKILLVDDEKLVLKSLEYSVDWNLYGFEIAGTANCAMEALEKMEQLSPDVVFTDIHMTDISGLELLQMIRQRNPEIYCVVISGYAEFGYVQKAMELESVGYCLKPFDYDEIAKYLKRIRQKLDQKRVQQSAPWVLSDYMVRKDDAAVSYMKQFYLSQGIDFETQDIMAVCVTGLPHIEQLACVCSVPIGCQKQVCLIRETEKDSFLYELKKRVKKTVLHIGCSSRIESAAQAPRHILESFRCACQFFCESKPVFLKEAPKIWNDRKVIKKFQEELQRGEEGIRRGFEELREAFESGNCSIDAAVMIRNIVELMSEKVQKESVFDWDYDSLIEEYGHVRKMLRILEEQCLLSLKSETERTITNSTFHQIYQFVEENYRSPVTASDIAEKFHINNCYVSQLFRKETGKTFTEYITEKRIQYVCTLLKHSEQNINEIAEQAGFKDYFYFSRVFRKIMKCTPTEYRNLAN